MRRTWGRWFNNKTSPTSEEYTSPVLTNLSTSSFSGAVGGKKADSDWEAMEDENVDYVQIIPFDSYNFNKAKERASMKWLLSKAYNNKAPDDLSEPFYKDHEGEEHLKPHIVKGLSDAELYCLALCNLYADPNYSQLSPWGIVQALGRKGVYIPPLPDIQLTETVLIQNRPLRMVAHMAVVEALMALQVKEIIHAERIVSAVQSYGPSVNPREMPSDSEEAFILWINRSIIAIKDYIQNNNSRQHNLSFEQVESWNQLSLCQDISDLSDGVALCALLAFYCQDELALSEITLPANPGEELNVSESLWNLQIIQRICRESLPYNVCHFQLEDILYFQNSMKQNFLSFLADLFNQLELNPSSVVKHLGSHLPLPIRPGLTVTGEGVRVGRGYVRLPQISTIPDLRPSLYSCATASAAQTPDRGGVKSQSASSTPRRQTPSKFANRKSTINIHLGESTSPSSQTVVTVPVNRRSHDHHTNSADKINNKDQRRYGENSSEDSEEFVVHRGRNVPTLTQVIRSVSPSSQDERSSPGSRMALSRNQMESEDFGIPAAGRPSNLGANKTSYAGRRSRRNSFSEADSQLTVENFGGSQDNLNRFVIGKNPDKQPAVLTDTTDSPIRYPKKHSNVETPLPELHTPQEVKEDTQHNPSVSLGKRRLESGSEGGRYPRGRDPERETFHRPYQQNSNIGSSEEEGGVRLFMLNDGRKNEFMDAPMRTTSLTNLSRLSDLTNTPVNIVYLQSATNGNGSEVGQRSSYIERGTHHRHQVEQPSRRAPSHSHYRSTSPQSSHSSPHSHEEGKDEEDTDELAAQLATIRLKLEDKRRRIELEKGRMESVASKNQFKLGKAAYLKAINKDLESKWLQKSDEGCGTPEIENMDMETYQKSLAKMDTSLCELENDIGRLSAQQEQIQRQFFLHGDDEGKRKTWTMPAASSGGSRTYWSPPRSKEDSPHSYWDPPPQNGDSSKTGSHSTVYTSKSPSSVTNGISSFRLHSNADSQGNRLFSRPGGDDEERPTPPPRQRSLHQAPLPTPSSDDMEPQSVSFVQEDNPPSSAELTSIASSKRSMITSGSKTYRITPESGSPPRPSAHRVFNTEHTEHSLVTSDETGSSLGERGFYIPLDPEAPVRPKPPLRTKSPAKRPSHEPGENKRDLSSEYVRSIVSRSPVREGTFGTHVDATLHSDSQKPAGELVLDEKQLIDSGALDLMEKKKERILMQSLRRQQQSEEGRRIKEMELLRRKEEEAMKADEKFRKREEEKARKQAILESYRIKKCEDLDKEGKAWEVQEGTKRFLRPKSGPPGGPKPRPKTIHSSQVDSGASSYSQRVPSSSGLLRRSDSQTSSTGIGRNPMYPDMDGGGRGENRTRSRVRDPWGSTSSLNQDNRRRGVNMYDNRRARSRSRELSTSRLEVRGRQPSYMGMGMGSQDYIPQRGNSTSSLIDDVEWRNGGGFHHHGDSDSGVGTCTPPPRNSASPPTLTKNIPPQRSLPSPSAKAKPWPGSLPPGFMSRRNRFDDGASDISVGSSNMDYSGLRLYKQPTAKSNRGIMLNAIEYCVFPGVVNREAKLKVLDEVNRSESKHFLLMFRDAGCQFRALYTYLPETDEIVKLYGVGPKQVNDAMFEKFFKYNSGGKCFSQVHTKHLTVTIDAFTIHNALWQGKKAPGIKGKDMALVV